MKNLFFYLTIFSFLLMLLSCKKESVVFYWDETACSDPWRQKGDDTDEERKISIESYLTDQNIDVENIDFEFDERKEQFCEACNCTTGRIIVMEVSAKDKRKMKKLDFYN